MRETRQEVGRAGAGVAAPDPGGEPPAGARHGPDPPGGGEAEAGDHADGGQGADADCEHAGEKQVVKSRKSIARLEQTRCSLNALNLQLTTAIASASASSAMKLSASMMKEMNQLASMPELQRTMQEMRTEMARAEVVDEMMEEFHEVSDDEQEIEAELQKVMDELVLDRAQLMGGAAAGHGMATPASGTPADALPPRAAPGAGQPLQERVPSLQPR
ncbi:unnamed protein product [Prorocentrum cordatum]|uniref:Uncharacterized protein n=1 Tax=Prorocentrum cordatum TaxID=2364126 RepID=A0ABN9VSG1_9DINO|nr:unnamed protein product [Polarella glacialis]